MDIPPIDGQALLSRLSQTDSVGLFVYDSNLTICEWNGFMEELTGIFRSDCLEKKLSAIVRTTSPDLDEQAFRRALQGEQFMLRNKAVLTQNGQAMVKKVDLLCLPLEEPNHRICCVAVIVTEVKEGIQEERPKSREGVAQQETALRSLRSFLKYAPMPIYIIDKNYRVQLANEAFNQVFGVRNPIGKRLERVLRPEVFSSEVVEEQKKMIREVMEKGQAKISRETYTFREQRLYFHIIRFPIQNAKGEFEAVGGYALDITERVEQEQKIQQLLSKTIALNEELEIQNEELTENRMRLEATNKRLQQKKKKLQAAMKELSERNFELDQIMYKTSHDLRSPLTSILGLLTLAKDEKDPEKLPEYFGYMEDRVGKLDNFVKSMLTYAKAGRQELNPTEINWEALIEDSLGNLEYMANFPEITITQEYRCKDHLFKSDVLRLEIILNNLLGNAIKYADLQKPNPYIHIQVDTGPGEAVISIQDNGIGIEKRYISEIGKMFFRATDKSEGSGLGMYIVKQAIEKLQGSMEIASEPGKGTTVEASLPSLG